MKKKIAVITGTRAEYGLLFPLIKKISVDDNLELKLIVTGAHLSPEFGLTYKLIESDGFKIDKKIEILLSSDSDSSINKSMGLAMISFGEYFEENHLDMIVVLGDRYEIFAAASAAAISKIPIAHIHGGETTEGATDEFLRHSITKMSYLHFTSAEEYRRRVIQMGESPDRVFNVGALGVENIKKMKLMSKKELENSIEFSLDKKFGLVTFHPVTMESGKSEEQFKELLKAIDSFEDMSFIITKANADSDGRIINKMIDEYVAINKNRVIAFNSMGQLRYLSAMKYCSIVIGNSSSGIIESPSFEIPTVNIGDRQKGRIQAKSIINCEANYSNIKSTIEVALSKEFNDKISVFNSPYGDGTTSVKILETIKEYLLKNKINLKKTFYNL
ncbi:UDP-N-acetylglucosamine 2-epimerase [Clostridium sp. CTA-7]